METMGVVLYVYLGAFSSIIWDCFPKYRSIVKNKIIMIINDSFYRISLYQIKGLVLRNCNKFIVAIFFLLICLNVGIAQEIEDKQGSSVLSNDDTVSESSDNLENSLDDWSVNGLYDSIVQKITSFKRLQNNINFGPVTLHPSFNVSGVFDDNVFNSSQDKVDDYYTRYDPSLSALFRLKKHLVGVNYNASIYEYTRNYDREIRQDRVNQSLNGLLNLNFNNGFNVTINNKFSKTRIPAKVTRRVNPSVLFIPFQGDGGSGGDGGDGDGSGGEDGGGDGDGSGDGGGGQPIIGIEEPSETLEQFGFNTISQGRDLTSESFMFNVDLPDFFKIIDFGINYTNIEQYYKDDDGSDQSTDVFTGTFSIKPLSKISITSGFAHSIIRYDFTTQNDSNKNSVPFRVVWNPTAKSDFFLDYNYNMRDYGNSSHFKNFKGYDSTLGYRFAITKRDNLTIKFERSLKEQQFVTKDVLSGGREIIVVDGVDGSSSRKVGVLNHESIGNNNPYFFTQINIEYLHRLSTKMTFRFVPYLQTLRFFEERDSFQIVRGEFETSNDITIPEKGKIVSESQEKVDAYGLNLSLRYEAMRGWFFGELSYNFQKRKSNQFNGDLEENVGEFSIGLNF